MTPEQEAHLQSVKDEITQLIDAKYRAGQKEHGGNLWDKKGILDMSVEEVVDMVVYILTFKRQLHDAMQKYGFELGTVTEPNIS